MRETVQEGGAAVDAAAEHARADRAQLLGAIGNRAVQRLARGTSADRAVLQRYLLQNPVSVRGTQFHAQVKQASGSFRDAQGKVVVQPTPNPQLRVSEDGQMAIEHTNLANRQPKVFYATTAVLDASNTALAAHGSTIKLYVDKKKAITVTDQHANQVELHRILPKLASAGFFPSKAEKGMTMTIDEVCDTVANKIAGIHISNLMPTLDRDLGLTAISTELAVHEYKIARWFYDRWFIGNKATANANVATAVRVGAGGDERDQIAHDYMQVILTAPNVAAQIARKLGVNEFADPRIGQVFGSITLGDPAGGVSDFSQAGNPKRQTIAPAANAAGIARDIWGTHYGAVVAESAGNKVTLENYGRKGEEAENFSGPIYYFQMYGPAHIAAQTWHGQWTTAPNPVLNALTMVYG